MSEQPQEEATPLEGQAQEGQAEEAQMQQAEVGQNPMAENDAAVEANADPQETGETAQAEEGDGDGGE